MQVSGVNEVFWSVLNGVLLLLSHLRLLDRLGDQLVGDFVRGVYTNKKKYAMQQLEHSAMHEHL